MRGAEPLGSHVPHFNLPLQQFISYVVKRPAHPPLRRQAEHERIHLLGRERHGFGAALGPAEAPVVQASRGQPHAEAGPPDPVVQGRALAPAFLHYAQRFGEVEPRDGTAIRLLAAADADRYGFHRPIRLRDAHVEFQLTFEVGRWRPGDFSAFRIQLEP